MQWEGPRSPPRVPPGLPCPTRERQHADVAHLWHGTSRPAGTCGREQLTAAEHAACQSPRDLSSGLHQAAGDRPFSAPRPLGRSNYRNIFSSLPTSPERIRHKARAVKAAPRPVRCQHRGSHLTSSAHSTSLKGQFQENKRAEKREGCHPFFVLPWNIPFLQGHTSLPSFYLNQMYF